MTPPSQAVKDDIERQIFVAEAQEKLAWERYYEAHGTADSNECFERFRIWNNKFNELEQLRNQTKE